MKKVFRISMMVVSAVVFAVTGVSLSFISVDKVNAETSAVTVESTDSEAYSYGKIGDVKWVINDEKQLIISKNNIEEVCSTGNWVETYIEYETVYTIDGGSFEIPVEKERILDTPWNKYDYNSVIIEEGVTQIGACSFYSAKFEKISLPDSLIVIDTAAFKGTETSAEFAFPPNLTDIGDAAFMYSGFNFGDAVLPKSLSALGEFAFSGCLELESVDLSQSSVKDIKEYAFYDCKNLKSVTFPNQLESIRTKAFANTIISEYIILSQNAKLEYKSMGYYSLTGEPQTTETKFIGYTGSTLAEYAAGSDDFTFEALDDGKGDLNFDGLIDKHDIQILQEYLVNKTKLDDKTIERADILEDDSLNVFDAILFKRKLIESNEK